MVVQIITPMEADALTASGVRSIGTITCPACGSWVFHPPRVSSSAQDMRHAPARATRD